MAPFHDPRQPVRGRGASWNPRNRFERSHLVPDGSDLENLIESGDEELPAPETHYLPDHSASAIARNDSPDVGFAASVNPYRGCAHGCSYCLAPDTPILHADMAWRPIGNVRVGDVLFAFDEYPTPGRTRKLRPSVVERVWWSVKPTMRLITSRTEVITTAEHRWLHARGFRWSRTDRMAPGRLLRHVPFAAQEDSDEDYRVGYLSGLALVDGTFRYEPGWRSELARIHALTSVERPTKNYRRGFLAGFFDAEGHNGDSLRISQVDLSVLERVRRYAGSLGFQFQLELGRNRASTLRLVGRLVDRIRFFTICGPAIQRKLDGLFGREMNFDPERVEAIEAGGSAEVVDIQTSTGTFCAAGLATHNCFARPTHEYLGFSAGLDFETKILVKEDAPELLRRELSSRRWTPQVLGLSGVTDPYQPIERRLRVTRRCLEVLVEFRNPVAVITKNHGVTRDADLLGELAQVEAAAVNLSITTLRPELARVMEPRTSTPARRLAAIERLARAGVPVGVLVAPVIPGLTDHELAAILRASADAGASFAGYVMLRLPHAVAPLFDTWLAQHFPGQREKVLGRIREVRGGRLYDARFGVRLSGEGVYAEGTAALFAAACRKAGLSPTGPALSTAAFRRPETPGASPQQELALST